MSTLIYAISSLWVFATITPAMTFFFRKESHWSPVWVSWSTQLLLVSLIVPVVVPIVFFIFYGIGYDISEYRFFVQSLVYLIVVLNGIFRGIFLYVISIVAMISFSIVVASLFEKNYISIFIMFALSVLAKGALERRRCIKKEGAT